VRSRRLVRTGTRLDGPFSRNELFQKSVNFLIIYPDHIALYCMICIIKRRRHMAVVASKAAFFLPFCNFSSHIADDAASHSSLRDLGLLRRPNICVINRSSNSGTACDIWTARHDGPSRRLVHTGLSLIKLEHKRHFITTRAPLYSHFSKFSALSTIGWCPENFVMISLTVHQELSCWDRHTCKHTNTQTDKPVGA